jgi:ATP-dependent DNA helicase RecQ
MPSSSGAWTARLPKLLRHTFGLKALREGQHEVIARVMDGKPTLAVMPTGAGKSLCYQVPAALLPGRTVVVSPLIALMKDQCDKLVELGIPAVQLNSATDAAETARADESVLDGSARIVFTTPERLAEPSFLQVLGSHPVSLLVVDEAHCISQWGHDFRPAFLEIGNALAELGHPTLLALTATATASVIEDIGVQLGVPELGVVNTGVYRPNLIYRVEQVAREEDKLTRAIEQVKAFDGPGIVYAATIKATEAVHEALVAAGESATRYHGRLAAGERHANQEAFMRGDARVMVATNAFGLGIDKLDTRFVLHYQMPSGLDAYYQESGRAGRDGEDAVCTLLFLHSDKAVQQFFLTGRYPALEDVDALYRALQHTPPQPTGWTVDELVEALDRPETKVQVAMRLLRQQGVAMRDRDGRLRLTQEQLDGETIATLVAAYQDKREHDKAMLERMVFYGQTGRCRWKLLLDHFNENEGFESCGRCDNCVRLATAAAVGEAPAQPDVPAPPSPHAPHAVGDRVQVRRYGLGHVIAADAHTVTVRFDEGATRCFDASFIKPARGIRRAAPRLPAGTIGITQE